MTPGNQAYYGSALRAICLAIAADKKIQKIEHSIRSIGALESIFRTSLKRGLPEDFITAGVETDILALQDVKQNRNYEVRRLLGTSLVKREHLVIWNELFETALENILKIEPSFLVWTEWMRRIAYDKKANFVFDNKEADSSIVSFLVQNRNPIFWNRSPQRVNGDISNMIREAHATQSAQVPAQNENAISFQRSDSGKIALQVGVVEQRLRDDQDARDRYSECIASAQELLERCKGSNSAARLVRILENYIEASGEDLSTVKPSLLVQRGERLRQEISAYEAIDTMLAPLSDDIILDLKAWRSAHNMMVGLDPVLMARDTAQLGPDAAPALLTPNEVHDLALDAETAGILEKNVVDVIVEAASLAPIQPNPNDRRTVWSAETGRNLIIETFNLALNNPIKTVVGVTVAGTVLPPMGIAGAVTAATVGAIPAAKFLLNHREWIETRLGDSPTWKSLFGALCDWIESNTPWGTKEKK